MTAMTVAINPRPAATMVGPLGPWLPARECKLVITAEQAKTILENHNQRNRARRKAHVNKLAVEMADDRWLFNGAPIIFDRNGSLIDGQHRLAAMVAAGREIEFMVVFGVDPETYQTVDHNKVRSLGDDLHAYGHVNSTQLAATARLCYAYATGERTQAVFSPRDPFAVIGAYIEEQGEPLLASARFANSANSRTKQNYVPIPGRIVGACHFLFGQKDEFERDSFFSGLCTGAGLEQNDPVLVARRRIFMDATGAQKRGFVKDMPFVTLVVMIKAWNAMREGRRVSNLLVQYTDKGSTKIPQRLPEII